MHSMMMTLKVVADVDAIIERELNMTLDKTSYAYSRYTMHLRYLLDRLAKGEQTENSLGRMLRQVQWQYPDIYKCAAAVADYLRTTWDWQCTDDETLYLTLHISRLHEKTTAQTK